VFVANAHLMLVQERLAASEAAIQEELQVLQDAQLMVLHEADVHQVGSLSSSMRPLARMALLSPAIITGTMWIPVFSVVFSRAALCGALC
jgi:hypothetical protein